MFELLQAHEMCDYYSFASRAGTQQNTVVENSQDYEVLNNPAIASKFIEWTVGSTSRLRFFIPTMHCASCVWLLDQLHRFDSGIKSSSVNFIQKSVHVDIDPKVTSVASVAALLTSVGYAPALFAEGVTASEEEARRINLRGLYMRLGIAGFAFGNIMMFAVATYFAGGVNGLTSQLHMFFSVCTILLTIPVLLYSAQPWFLNAYRGLRSVLFRKGGLRAWNLDIPVALGMIAIVAKSFVDIVRGTGEGYLDSFTGLVFFLLIGRLVLHKTYDVISFDRTYRSFFPLSTRRDQLGVVSVVPIEEIRSGDILRLRNAEVIPTDCVLLDAVAYVDYSFVTGESRPVECLQGEHILAGGKNIGKEVRMSALQHVNHERLASLWERSKRTTRNTVFNELSDRFGLLFTVTTLAIAFAGLIVWLPDYGGALRVFASVLIIACPCALTIAAPITFGHAMGLLGKRGIYLRSPMTIAELLDVDVIVFDKTGTLTTAHGDLDFRAFDATEVERQYIRALAKHSTHPMSRAMAEHIKQNHEYDCTVVEEFPGQGIRGIINGVPVLIGRCEFVQCNSAEPGTHCSVDGRYVGSITLKPVQRFATVSNANQHELVLLSGDTSRDASAFEPMFGTNMWFSQSPTEKVERVREIQRGGKRVLMVGDGLNDASAFNAADVSIAVSDRTSTLAPASDVVVNGDNVVNVGTLLRYASSMRTVVWICFVFTVFYNILGFTLAVQGVLSPVITAVLMPISNLVVIGISIGGARLLYRRLVWE